MNRTKWEFPYTADKLLDAATAKHTHHTERLLWWDNQKKTTIEQVKAEGIEVDESLYGRGGTANNNTNYYRQPTVQVRNDLVKDLEECVSKIQEHRQKVSDYDAWIQVLSSQGQSSFALNQEDWLFFFGK